MTSLLNIRREETSLKTASSKVLGKTPKSSLQRLGINKTKKINKFMKKLEKIFFSMIAMIMLVAVGSVFTSCTNDDDFINNESSAIDLPMDSYTSELLAIRGSDSYIQTRSYGDVFSIWGDNNATPLPSSTVLFYAFPESGQQLTSGVKLKIYYHGWVSDQTIANNGNIEYVTMLWNSSANAYYCNKSFSHLGLISYRFVSGTDVSVNLTDTNKQIKVQAPIALNTNGTTYLYWPFGWDGSTYSNMGGWSCARDTHPTGASAQNEYFAQDWNWGSGSADYGRLICSPITGTVTQTGVGPSTYGNIVDIETTISGYTIRVRFAHLKDILVSEGDYVGPNSYVATIGNSGGNFSPHLHCALNWVDSVTDANIQSLEYVFSASI